MKKRYLKFIYLLIPISFLIVSCEKWINPDINIDPNKPSYVPLELLLPTAEAGSAMSAAADLILPSEYWMQHLFGLGSQAGYEEVYTYLPTSADNLWKWDTYGGVMMDMHQMIVQAKLEESPYYGGVAKILMAYKLMITSDMFGDVPYTDAFQGDANLHPTYNTQEEIYTTILPGLLDSAIIDLNAPSSVYAPGADDLFYQGDLTKWVKAANALKARMYIHLSKVSPTAYANALAAAANAFTSNDDDIQLTWGSNANEQNPIFQMMDQRPGYIGGLGANLVNMMNNNTPANLADDDPRLPIYADTITGNQYVGCPAGGSLAEVSQIGAYFASPTSPTNILSYVEIKFIEAEAYFQTGNKAAAADTFNVAVKASLAKFDVSNPAWETAHASETAGTITLSKIMNAKYIALYLNNEVFSDWRRNDTEIVLTPAIGNTTGGVIPRRLLYPQEEITTNYDNVPKGLTVKDRVWWDKP
jgi:hypothetical protein